ncbi:MAG TPA: hypothetical protein VMK12_05830, partial [Anaeromyxobacteraceae bacterium]|nr:hypothetical protein [Anaeromyxobacteraceae bacterium]
MKGRLHQRLEFSSFEPLRDFRRPMLTPGFEPLSPATLFAGVVLATPHHDSQAPARQGSMSQGVLPARDLPSGRSWRLPASPLGSRPDASGGALGEKARMVSAASSWPGK